MQQDDLTEQDGDGAAAASPWTNRTWLYLSILVVVELSAAFETGMILPAIPTLIRHFGDPIGVGWLVTSYLLASAACAALCGRLGDIFGRKLLLVIVLVVMTIGSLISGMSDSLFMVIVGRTLQGIAGAALPLCLGIARQILPARSVPIAVGVLAGTASIGAGSGFVIGAIIVDHISWQSLFTYSAMLSAAGTLLVFVFMRRIETPTKSGGQTIDWVGGTLFVPALVGILLALTDALRIGVTSPLNLAMLVGSIMLLIIWVRYELRHPNPLLDMRLFMRREVLLANGAMAFSALGAFQLTQVLSMLMQQPAWTMVGLGATATMFGLLKIPGYIAGFIGASVNGILASRLSPRTALIISGTALSAPMGVMAFYHGAFWPLLCFATIAQMGVSMVYAGVPNVILSAVPSSKASESAGLGSVVRAGFQAIGSQLVMVTLMSAQIFAPDGSTKFPSAGAYNLTLGMLFAFSVAAIVMSLLLPRHRAGVSAPEHVKSGV